MIDVIKDILYWLINISIVILGIAYAINLWNDKIRTLKGVALFLGGILWHILRAIFNYSSDRCESLTGSDSLLTIANKCIPPRSGDIIWAQIAIFVGLFIIIAEIYGRYRNNLCAGIDLGTSGCRIVVIDLDKKIQFSHSITYPENSEQTPELWWSSVSELLKQLPQEIRKNLISLAVDGTSGSVLLTDSQGVPTSSTLMYYDLRATEEAKLIKTALPKENGGQGASGSLARLLWLLKHEANPKHAHVLHQADYILGKLANNFRLSDENNCLKLGYDVINRCWPEEQLSKIGIEASLLPIVHPAGTAVATIDKTLAHQLALPETLQLVSGTTDSIAAFYATGASQVGEAVTSLGSTLVIKLITDKPVFSPEYGIYSHRFGNYWLLGGASNSGGNVIRKYFSEKQIEEMTAQLTPYQLTGLEYYPLAVKGERFPVADSNKAPILEPHPESDIDFFQGILEGIASIEGQGYQTLSELSACTVLSIRSVGGGSKNKAWTQIRKNKLNVEMIKPEQSEAAYGSALLAMKGGFENLQEKG